VPGWSWSPHGSTRARITTTRRSRPEEV
jgi:hypothetical protein